MADHNPKIQSILQEKLQIDPQDILDINDAAGMTNTNTKVKVKDGKGTKEYFVRIPGFGTESMLNRRDESANVEVLAKNPDVIRTPECPYIDSESGVKITVGVPNAKTLNAKDVKQPNYSKEIARMLRSLHNSTIEFTNAFDPFAELKKYEKLATKESVIEAYEDYEKQKELITKVFSNMKIKSKPCHNDLVAENFLEDDNGDLYLIDWEYGGMNDPSWDVAMVGLESEFTEEELTTFLKYYLDQDPDDADIKRVYAFQSLMDLVWSVWTIIKENAGDDFGTYGQDRYKRGSKLLKKVLN